MFIPSTPFLEIGEAKVGKGKSDARDYALNVP